MPYITGTAEVWDKFYDLGAIDCAGDLNYLITEVLSTYLLSNGWNYSTMNDIIGALECAKMEFSRRVVVPYEKFKMEDNGDVYPTPPPIIQKRMRDETHTE